MKINYQKIKKSNFYLQIKFQSKLYYNITDF